MRTIIWIALAYCLAMRVFELTLSRRNAARVVARGGRVVSEPGWNWIVLVHTAWFVGLIAEERWLGPSYESAASLWSFGLLFVAAEAMRLWCIRTLGDRWNVRVVVHPDEPRIEGGPYRITAHPNYIAATLMIASLPLALGLPYTALVLTPLKVLAVRARIRVEDACLDEGR